uniref:non-specific serine/threonine protein kinase n=1 Tax=Gouania willdenowi TaxID=441366 RepID=A0A8C5G8Z4_GOUWI
MESFCFTSRYKEEKLLGEGGFSQVYAGERRSTSTPVAIKHISKKDVFENPAVIGLMDVFHLETEVKVIFKQIINAALLMHKNGVFHRDLKLENILVNRSKGTPEIRVIDFGFGDFVENEPFRYFYGTLDYAPPEHIHKEAYKAEAMTVWQIGVMLHMICTMVCFKTSVYIKKDKELLKNVSKGCNDFLKNVSMECNDFLSQCLALDPNQRPTLEDLLLHPWLELTGPHKPKSCLQHGGHCGCSVDSLVCCL